MKTMKLLLVFSILSCFIFLTNIYAQSGGVSINNTSDAPHPSAMLDVSSTNKGAVFPRVALVSPTDPVSAPIQGLVVFNISTSYDGPGYYYFDGTDWQSMSPDSKWESASGDDIYKNDGNVGIGVVNTSGFKTYIRSPQTPGSKEILNLEGYAGNFQFRTNSTSGYTATFELNDNGLRIGHNSSGRNIHFETNNIERMSINSAGAITINDLSGSGTRLVTASPSGELSTVNSPAFSRYTFFDSGGCPPNRPALTDLAGGSFTVNSNAIVYVTASNIRIATGRHDFIFISKRRYCSSSHYTY